MAGKQICPHCREEFDQDDLRELRICMDFEKKYSMEIKKIRRRGRFFKSGWMVLLMFILAMCVDSFSESSPWLISAMITVLVAMFYVPYSAGKKEASLLSQYKKEINA